MVTTPHTLYIAGGFKNHCDSANFHAVTPWCSNLFVHQMAGAPYGYTNGSGPAASALPLLTANQPLPNSTESETLRVGFNHLCTNSPHYTQVILLKTEMWSTSEPL